MSIYMNFTISSLINSSSDRENNMSNKKKRKRKGKGKRKQNVGVRVYFFYKDEYAFSKVYPNLSPNISKYARVSKKQKMDETRNLIGICRSVEEFWILCYLPWDITLRFFLVDCDFDLKTFWYIGRYLLTDEEYDMTIQELYDRNILARHTCITGYPKKRFFSLRDITKVTINCESRVDKDFR